MKMKVLFLEQIDSSFLEVWNTSKWDIVQLWLDNFHRKLLKIVFSKSKKSLRELTHDRDLNLTKLKLEIPDVLIPSIASDCHKKAAKLIQLLEEKHNKKIDIPSEYQNKPCFNINESVKVSDEGITIPDFVKSSLSRGARSPMLDRFDKNDVLAEINSMLGFTENQCTPFFRPFQINDIRNSTLAYVQSCATKTNPELENTKEWLKKHKIKAVPGDKSNSFTLIKETEYEAKI